MMPAMKFMSEDDTALLWQWLKAIATEGSCPPTRRSDREQAIWVAAVAQ